MTIATRFVSLTVTTMALMAVLGGPAVVGQQQWNLPPRVAAPIVSPGAPMTDARVHSGGGCSTTRNGTQSCAACHGQERAFSHKLRACIRSPSPSPCS
jgi:hypothetical protein